MRTGVLLIALGAWMLSGATCLPLLDIPSDTAAKPTTLSIVIQSPVSNATVPQGGTVPIKWTAYNGTGGPASIDVYAESRTDLSKTYVVENMALNAGSLTNTSDWDTTGLARGEYVIYANITAGSDTKSDTAAGRITIDEFPTFAFTAPTENATFTQGGDALKITWKGSDPEGAGKVTIGLDVDTDPQNGNELFLHEDTLGATDAEASFDWSGKDLLNDDVAGGVYNLFALVSDAASAEQAIQANVQITVVEKDDSSGEEQKPIGISIITPDADTTFLTSDASLEIKFGVNQFEDTRVDLRIDTDDNHSNGNEQSILAQRLVSAGTESDTFDWDGTLVGGGTVADGIYRLVIVADTGATTLTTAQSKGLVFRRSTADQSLIGLLNPATDQTVQAGSDLRITWRYDDPSGSAKVRLTIDDDPNPAEAVETVDPEREIMAPRPASDGVSFFYHVPTLDQLPAGRYYVFAYIGAAPEDPLQPRQVSVAPATFIVKDPATP